MKTEKYADIEIVIDDMGGGPEYDRYYIISGWNTEVYNGVEYREVPNIEREIYYKEYQQIKILYLREKKLKRILKQTL